MAAAAAQSSLVSSWPSATRRGLKPCGRRRPSLPANRSDCGARLPAACASRATRREASNLKSLSRHLGKSGAATTPAPAAIFGRREAFSRRGCAPLPRSDTFIVNADKNVEAAPALLVSPMQKRFGELLLACAAGLGPVAVQELTGAAWLSGLRAKRVAPLPAPLLELWARASRLPTTLLASPRSRGCLMLNALVLLYATNWSVVKIADESMDPSLFLSLRFLVAALPFAPFLGEALGDAEVLSAGAELGFWSFLGYQAQAISLQATDASKCAFLSTFTVLAVPLVACLYGKPLKLRTVLAAFGAVTGVGLLEQGGTTGICSGDLWAVLSALLFAVQIYRTEVHARRLPADSRGGLMSSLLVMIALFSLSAALGKHFLDNGIDGAVKSATSIKVALQAEGLQHLSMLALAGSVLYTGLCTTALTLWLEMAALRSVEASDCAVIYSMEPLLGAGIAWITLGERWGPAGWVGAALIVASTMSAQIGDSGEAESDGTSVDL